MVTSNSSRLMDAGEPRRDGLAMWALAALAIAVAWACPRALYFRCRNPLCFAGVFLAAALPYQRDPAYVNVRLRGGSQSSAQDAWRAFVGARVLKDLVSGAFVPVGSPSLCAASALLTQALSRSPATCASPLLAAHAPALAAFHAAAAWAALPALLVPASAVGYWPSLWVAGARARCEVAVLYARVVTSALLVPALLAALRHPVLELAALRGGRLARAEARWAAALRAAAPARGARLAAAALAYYILVATYSLTVALLGDS